MGAQAGIDLLLDGENRLLDAVRIIAIEPDLNLNALQQVQRCCNVLGRDE